MLMRKKVKSVEDVFLVYLDLVDSQWEGTISRSGTFLSEIFCSKKETHCELGGKPFGVDFNMQETVLM